MEDALAALQQSLESANHHRDAAVDKMSHDERIDVRQMLNALHVRLVNLQEHVDDRKTYVICCYSATDSGAEYRGGRLCLSVREHISRSTRPKK